MGSQIVAGAANSVINATKSAASKNIRKIKVTIKTNYRILLKDAKKIEIQIKQERIRTMAKVLCGKQLEQRIPATDRGFFKRAGT